MNGVVWIHPFVFSLGLVGSSSPIWCLIYGCIPITSFTWQTRWLIKPGKKFNHLGSSSAGHWNFLGLRTQSISPLVRGLQSSQFFGTGPLLGQIKDFERERERKRKNWKVLFFQLSTIALRPCSASTRAVMFWIWACVPRLKDYPTCGVHGFRNGTDWTSQRVGLTPIQTSLACLDCLSSFDFIIQCPNQLWFHRIPAFSLFFVCRKPFHSFLHVCLSSPLYMQFYFALMLA